jgi:hypothetical protein
MSTMPMPSDWITVREAADTILGVTPQRVHQLIAAYGITTEKPSPRVTFVRRKDVERVAAMERPSGVHQGQ